MSGSERKPSWLRVSLPQGAAVRRMDELLSRRRLNTVCDEARCPNKGECWGAGTATFMIMGAVCTRNCRFCAVATGREGEALAAAEPLELAAAVRELGLRYAVVTSVDRDDLPDRGASHFAACVRAIKAENPAVLVEVLVPDYREGEIEVVLDAAPDVFAHNVETVPRLQGVRDARASFALSLRSLSLAAARSAAGGGGGGAGGGGPVVKSSVLLGLGETEGELYETMDALRAAGCSSLVLGQYLRPGRMQLEVARYVTPEEFARYAEAARARGFSSVVAAPLARTSYHAREGHEAVAAARAGAAAAASPEGRP